VVNLSTLETQYQNKIKFSKNESRYRVFLSIVLYQTLLHRAQTEPTPTQSPLVAEYTPSISVIWNFIQKIYFFQHTREFQAAEFPRSLLCDQDAARTDVPM
jgi:hypothetical protein